MPLLDLTLTSAGYALWWIVLLGGWKRRRELLAPRAPAPSEWDELSVMARFWARAIPWLFLIAIVSAVGAVLIRDPGRLRTAIDLPLGAARSAPVVRPTAQ